MARFDFLSYQKDLFAACIDLYIYTHTFKSTYNLEYRKWDSTGLKQDLSLLLFNHHFSWTNNFHAYGSRYVQVCKNVVASYGLLSWSTSQRLPAQPPFRGFVGQLGHPCRKIMIFFSHAGGQLSPPNKKDAKATLFGVTPVMSHLPRQGLFHQERPVSPSNGCYLWDAANDRVFTSQ